MDDFDEFWQAYPRKVAKKEARKAFEKAIREVSLPEILEAIEAYKRGKPEYCDFCHPSTWLNQGRWEDEYEQPVDHAEIRKRDYEIRIARQIAERDRFKVVK